MPPWLAWTFAALLSWGVWGVLSKVLGDALTPGQSQVLSTLALVPILAFLTRTSRAEAPNLTWRGTALAAGGGIISCAGNVVYYDALNRGTHVAAVISLTALYPLVTVLLAVLLLGERLNRVQQAGLLASGVAIWLFNVQDEGRLLSPAMALAVLPILFWGASGFLQKLATNHLPAGTAALLYLAAFVPVAAVLAFRESWTQPIAPRTWALVLALGFFLAFGNVAVLAAFARGGKAAVIAPLGSLYPLVSVSSAWLLLSEPVSRREWAGLACAIGSVAALSCESPPSPPPPTAAAPSPVPTPPDPVRPRA